MNDKIKNLVVDEFTSPDIKSVSPDTKLNDVIQLMEESDIRHLPVVLENKIEGIISERDVLTGIRKQSSELLYAKDIMTKNPYTVSPNTPMEEVAFYLSKNKIGSAVVCNAEDDYIGIFTNTDALNALVEVLREEY